MKKLGIRITQIRKQKGLKQVELASNANISKSYLSQIESGKNIPELKVLERICKALNVKVETLLIESLIEDDPSEVVHLLLNTIKLEENINSEKREILAEMKPILERLNKHFPRQKDEGIINSLPNREFA